MPKKYKTKEIKRSSTVLSALEHERDRQLESIRRSLEYGLLENLLFQIRHTGKIKFFAILLSSPPSFPLLSSLSFP